MRFSFSLPMLLPSSTTILPLLLLLQATRILATTQYQQQQHHLILSVPASTLLPHPSVLPASTRATLTTLSKRYTARYRTDETFSFANVSTGSYLLDVHCHTHAFAPLRVDVHGSRASGGAAERGGGEAEAEVEGTGEDGVQVWGTFRGNEWANKGEVVPVRREVRGKGKEEVFVFEAKVVGAKEYYTERSGFSPLSLLKNPMLLIAGVGMLVVFGMPYLLENMDPEMKAEFEARQQGTGSSGNGQSNPLQNFDAAAWLAGAGSGSGSGSGSRTEKRSEVVERGVTR